MTTASHTTGQSSGLEGQTVGGTSICCVNQTQLIYRGYEITDLAEHACFEEVAHLLLVGHKPDPEELQSFRNLVAEASTIPEGLVTLLRDIAHPGTHPMSTLRTSVSYLSHVCPLAEDNTPEAEFRKAIRLLAQIPIIISFGQRILDGEEPITPDTSRSIAWNLLRGIRGVTPDEHAEKVMDVSLILYAEHDFNASTFSSRVIASTLSDMHSAVCGGIGALKGSLHGGANEKAMDLLIEIAAYVESGKGSVRDFMDDVFAARRKVMGFGHRVYKNGDHRAPLLRARGMEAAAQQGPEAMQWFELGDEVQRIMLEEKGIHPNVDFPCGMTYYALGIPVTQYTPIFVASRITGWCAHIMEQHANNRLIRPLADYEGPALRQWMDDG